MVSLGREKAVRVLRVLARVGQNRPGAVTHLIDLNLHMMLYSLYCSSGNKVGVDEYVCYSEIGADGLWVRYIEIRSDGKTLRYDLEHPADQYGMLPEGEWQEAEASLSEFGTVSRISAELFEAVWSATRCINEGAG